MKNIIKLTALFFVAVISNNIFGQTFKADYVADNNGKLMTASSSQNTAGNIFNPSLTVDDLANYSWAGGVTWSSGNGIILQEVGFQSPAAGTAFYNLKTKYKKWWFFVSAVK